MFSCILVSDNGIGIADDEKPAVFGRFYRGRNVKDRKGVGIGLYLARQIIEEQGGYFIVAKSVNTVRFEKDCGKNYLLQ